MQISTSPAAVALLLASSLVTPGAASAAWPYNPSINVPLCTAAGTQQVPTIVSDGVGGAIVTWLDGRTDAGDIYAQRVNAAGVPQWTLNGVSLCAAAADQQNPTIVSDGTGGAIVTWQDFRNGVYNADIYAQRVNAAGVTRWTADGVPLCAASYNQT